MREQTRALVFIGLYAALVVLLEYVSDLIPFLRMPNGGQISLAVIPTFLASYHLGWKKGIATGLLGWLLGFLLGNHQWYLNPIQYGLDYLIPAAVIGAASLLPKLGRISNVYTGLTVTMIVVYICNLLSGVYFYFPDGAVAGSWAAWSYSLGYNLWYNLATLVVAAILVPLLIRRLGRTKVISFPFLKE